MKTNLQNSPEKIALLAHQNAIKDAKAAQRKLEKAISEQEALIVQTKAQEPDITQLKLERKDALAATAMGLKSADLTVLDAAIESAEALLKNIGPTVKRARETIEGLERMLSLELAKFDELQAQTKGMQRRFLVSEAEAAGAEYAQLALELVKRYKVLWALNAMLLDKSHTAISTPGEKLHVPCFALESTKPYAVAHQRGAIFQAPTMHADSMAWTHQEIARYQADGIDLS